MVNRGKETVEEPSEHGTALVELVAGRSLARHGGSIEPRIMTESAARSCRGRRNIDDAPVEW